VPYRSGSWNKEAGPDARAADIDAEHAPLAIAGPVARRGAPLMADISARRRARR
jgi:hypothetical protein